MEYVKKNCFFTILLTLIFSGVNLQPTLATTDLSFEQTLTLVDEDFSIQQRLPEKQKVDVGSLVRMSRSQAAQFVKSKNTNEHSFKEDFVGKSNVSKFDIAYIKDTKKVYLIDKSGKIVIETGYVITTP
ncbi:hypothetical protein [Metasolibacillus sp.]|uniref:hypothetical protein n=1 Tax=Metasolibacillus sp. TaxID=2703680 RepID=UPI0025E2D22F|nr:hypothetical protein [Metasolibacillus sp.]MCT6925246.1 hypothetical protein [Metasolibacillus sp.]MCT6941396.1 hypothetical protein [Metasolibacillus sp.]